MLGRSASFQDSPALAHILFQGILVEQGGGNSLHAVRSPLVVDECPAHECDFDGRITQFPDLSDSQWWSCALRLLHTLRCGHCSRGMNFANVL